MPFYFPWSSSSTSTAAATPTTSSNPSSNSHISLAPADQQDSFTSRRPPPKNLPVEEEESRVMDHGAGTLQESMNSSTTSSWVRVPSARTTPLAPSANQRSGWTPEQGRSSTSQTLPQAGGTNAPPSPTPHMGSPSWSHDDTDASFFDDFINGPPLAPMEVPSSSVTTTRRGNSSTGSSTTRKTTPAVSTSVSMPSSMLRFTAPPQTAGKDSRSSRSDVVVAAIHDSKQQEHQQQLVVEEGKQCFQTPVKIANTDGTTNTTLNDEGEGHVKVLIVEDKLWEDDQQRAAHGEKGSAHATTSLQPTGGQSPPTASKLKKHSCDASSETDSLHQKLQQLVINFTNLSKTSSVSAARSSSPSTLHAAPARSGSTTHHEATALQPSPFARTSGGRGGNHVAQEHSHYDHQYNMHHTTFRHQPEVVDPRQTLVWDSAAVYGRHYQALEAGEPSLQTASASRPDQQPAVLSDESRRIIDGLKPSRRQKLLEQLAMMEKQ